MCRSAYIAVSVLFWSALAYTARAEDHQPTHVVVTVIDPTVSVIPGAEVWIGRGSDSLKPFLFADDRRTLVADIEPGKYEIEAQSPGFRAQRQRLTVLKSVEQHVNISLQIGGGCSECVVVENAPVPEPFVSLPSPSENQVPSECRGNLPYIGLPVFSIGDKGVRYGLSLLQNHIVAPSPVPLYVWVDNTRGQEIKASGDCDLIRTAGIRVKSVHGRDAIKRVAPRGSQICSVEVPVRMPAHSCFAFAKVYLTDIYEIHSGVYSVFPASKGGEKRSGNGQRDRLLFQYQRLVPSR